MTESFSHSPKEYAVVTGLGIGEETKGVTVQWLTKQLNAHTIVRSGGSQGGAHVKLEDGREQMFSQFGAGTFEGAKTHLFKMVINPSELFEEAIEIEKQGIKNPFSLITIDSNCLTVTPYHSAISRFREIMRGNDKKGTVGKGVGDVIRDSGSPDISIRAYEFLGDISTLENKIENIRVAKLNEAREIISKSELPLSGDAQAELDLLYNKRLVGTTAESFKYIADLVNIVDKKYFRKILNQNGAIVNQTSHGALLHPWHGFVPYVTQIDPTAQDVLSYLHTQKYDGKIMRLGVSRSYMTRHGAGPLVSYNSDLTKSIHEIDNNLSEDNKWIGEFRNGNYDIVAMKYAIEISGGKETFNGLKISYMDEVLKAKEWEVCVAYKYEGKELDLERYFIVENGLITGIKVRPNTRDIAQLNHQIKLTQILKECQPILKTLRSENGKPLELVFIDFIETNLDLPVVATAYGTKISDRHIRTGHESLFASV